MSKSKTYVWVVEEKFKNAKDYFPLGAYTYDFQQDAKDKRDELIFTTNYGSEFRIAKYVRAK